VYHNLPHKTLPIQNRRHIAEKACNGVTVAIGGILRQTDLIMVVDHQNQYKTANGGISEEPFSTTSA
jgi:hypothetical protein